MLDTNQIEKYFRLIHSNLMFNDMQVCSRNVPKYLFYEKKKSVFNFVNAYIIFKFKKFTS